MPIGTTAAIIGAGVLGAGASALGASKNASAINKSTDSSLQAQREALAAQTAAHDKTLAAQQNALSQSLALQTNALNQNSGMQAGQYNSSGQLQTDAANRAYGTLNPFAQTGYASMNAINSLLGLPEQQAYQGAPLKFTPVQATQIALPATPTAAPVAPNNLSGVGPTANLAAAPTNPNVTGSTAAAQQAATWQARRFS